MPKLNTVQVFLNNGDIAAFIYNYCLSIFYSGPNVNILCWFLMFYFFLLSEHCADT